MQMWKYCWVIGISFLVANNIFAQKVETFAGSGSAGSNDGNGISATFKNPIGIAVDAYGNVYVSDSDNNKIRKITPSGVVSTLAGTGDIGNDDGIGTTAKFYSPSGLAVDASGNVYVADYRNNRIRKITPSGIVSTFAGNNIIGSNDGTGTAASFNSPLGIAIDAGDTLYVADAGNNSIRKITPEGVVSTLAVTGLNTPTRIAVDASRNLYVADAGQTIRKIPPNGVMSGLDGSFPVALGVAADAFGSIFVASGTTNSINKITPPSPSSIFAGGSSGSNDGMGTAASFMGPNGIAIDNNFGYIYIADAGNNKIRRITPAPGVGVNGGLMRTCRGDSLTAHGSWLKRANKIVLYNGAAAQGFPPTDSTIIPVVKTTNSSVLTFIPEGFQTNNTSNWASVKIVNEAGFYLSTFSVGTKPNTPKLSDGRTAINFNFSFYDQSVQTPNIGIDIDNNTNLSTGAFNVNYPKTFDYTYNPSGKFLINNTGNNYISVTVFPHSSGSGKLYIRSFYSNSSVCYSDFLQLPVTGSYTDKPQLAIQGSSAVNAGDIKEYQVVFKNDSSGTSADPNTYKHAWFYVKQGSFIPALTDANNLVSADGQKVKIAIPSGFAGSQLAVVSYLVNGNGTQSFDTTYYNIKLNTAAIPSATCTDQLGCTAFKISQFTYKGITLNQKQYGIECPGNSNGYSDFATAQYDYTDNLGQPASLELETPTLFTSEEMSVTVKGDTIQYYGFWLDCNADGDFGDPGEFLGSSAEATATYSTKLAIPNIVSANGIRRLRIKCGNKTLEAANYCIDDYARRGETEDYLINLQPYPELEAPEAFTPGKDGYNDVFIIRGIDPDITQCELSILDKLGTRVFNHSNYDNKWTGIDNNGKELPNGTYYYLFKNGKREISGFIELVRED